MSILVANHLKKSFNTASGKLEVLKDISLTVDAGEVVAIIGPSGSGKTTLLRCLTQLETVDDGSIAYEDLSLCKSVAGRAVYAQKDVLQRICKRYGLVFQNFNLFPHFNVLRNVTEALCVADGFSADKAKARGLFMLEQLGLADKAKAYPCQLSGGQQQRVAIARALAPNPAILFFDEPTSALDPRLTYEIVGVIRELAKQKMTMVIVTHEMSFAKDVADRIIFMSGGRVEAQGTPQEILQNSDNPILKAFLANDGNDED